MELSGKVALVTGGNRGIGKAISLALAEAGASVLLTYHTRQHEAREVARQINNYGGTAVSLYMDVRKRWSVSLVTMVAREILVLGSLDILVNNAGISQLKPFDQITDEDWTQMQAVNLQGAFMCCQEALPSMLNNKWGRIINIASVGGQWGGQASSSLCSIKSWLNLSDTFSGSYLQRQGNNRQRNLPRLSAY